MKKYQKGSTALLLIFIVIILGGCLYVYFEKNKNPSNEVEQKQKVNLDNNLKTFTQTNGVYSIKYPSDWTYSEGMGAVEFYLTPNKRNGKMFEINLGSDLEAFMSYKLPKDYSSEKVIFGKNEFTKLTSLPSGGENNIAYVLPISAVDGNTVFMVTYIESKHEWDSAEVQSFLQGIDVNPAKAANYVKSEF